MAFGGNAAVHNLDPGCYATETTPAGPLQLRVDEFHDFAEPNTCDINMTISHMDNMHPGGCLMFARCNPRKLRP